MPNLKAQIPSEISAISTKLKEAGFEAYLVGGCTRDLLIGRKPKDWDFTTNATPEQIVATFGSDETFYENDFGTVTVKNPTSPRLRGAGENDPSLQNVEITPYRKEGKYTDKRRPDEVTWAKTLREDLERRDFTINAIAYDISPSSAKATDGQEGQLIDPYNGQKDIKDKLIRAVGNPVERFEEDALRLLRALRIATELGFAIESTTAAAIHGAADLLAHIAKERIQVEFTKIVMSASPLTGIAMCEKLKLMPHILPELLEGLGIEQNGDHIYHVWEHNLRAVQHSADRNWPLHVRLGALLHDVGKPATRRWSEENKDWTFYGHDVVGARMTKTALHRLKYSSEIIEKVEKLVRWHLFFTDIDK
ncbi:MAG TPA: HD domain-containing protein, partial [Candidatus Paceibacterota bacterium]